MLTLPLPTENICLFNQSLLNALHLLSRCERVGVRPPAVCTLGFHEVGAQALSILSQVTVLGTTHRLLDKPTAFSTVSEESEGQFASGQALFIDVVGTTC